MKYKIKFNLFKYDKSGHPVKMQNKTIYLNSDTYDNTRKRILSLYPNAKYIVIFSRIKEMIKSRIISKTPKNSNYGNSSNMWELFKMSKNPKYEVCGNSYHYTVNKNPPGFDITRVPSELNHLPFRENMGTPKKILIS